MQSDTIVKMLTDLKRKAEQEEKKAYMLEGELNHLMKVLSDDFDCNSTDEAEKLLSKVEQECEMLRGTMNAKIDMINSTYDF